MFKNLMKLSWMFAAALALSLFLTSCEKDTVTTNNVEDIENFTDRTLFEMQERAGCGKRGCAEFVFPLTVVFPDATEVEVEDYAGLKEAVRTWRADNPDATERPTFAFPIEVVTRSGEMITIEDGEDLLKLRIRCRRAFGPHRPGHGGRHCFKLSYPLDIVFPNGEDRTIDGPVELKTVLRAWHRLNKGSEEKPALVFPINVELEDGSIVEVESKTALEELKDACGDEG